MTCGGTGALSNMQWQLVEEGKDKDKWERKGCQMGSLSGFNYPGTGML